MLIVNRMKMGRRSYTLIRGHARIINDIFVRVMNIVVVIVVVITIIGLGTGRVGTNLIRYRSGVVGLIGRRWNGRVEMIRIIARLRPFRR